MPTNLELKIRLTEPGKMISKLNNINAESKGELNQTDVYYNYKSGLLKLRIENGSQTLIKYLRNEKEGERWSDFQLIDLINNDARKYLEDILTQETVVEKKRLLFMYDNTRIHLDTVKNLGSFLELETLVINGKDDAENRFAKIKELLQLNDISEIRRSSRDLMLEKNNP